MHSKELKVEENTELSSKKFWIITSFINALSGLNGVFSGISMEDNPAYPYMTLFPSFLAEIGLYSINFKLIWKKWEENRYKTKKVKWILTFGFFLIYFLGMQIVFLVYNPSPLAGGALYNVYNLEDKMRN